MKKFRFSLETVLDYKQSTLDSLQIEYGTALAKVRRQEEILMDVQARYDRTNEAFREEKKLGLTIAGILSYETGLHVLEREIQREEAQLQLLRQEEVAIHAKLIESKIDTSSLELLREKKLVHYRQEVQKQEEHLIDDFVGFARLQEQIAL